MRTLIEVVTENAVRGGCQCGSCIDGVEPDTNQPTGHTVDMIFFKVGFANDDIANDKEAQAELREEFLVAIADHTPRYGETLTLLDGADRNYMQIGAWIGSQEIGTVFMALGELLGVWRVNTPVNMLHLNVEDPVVMMMAQRGFLSIQVRDKDHEQSQEQGPVINEPVNDTETIDTPV